MKKFRYLNKDIFSISVLFILALIFFYNPLLTGKTYFIGDIEAMAYPFNNYKYEMGQAGKLFLWDPYTFCGQPYIADLHTGIFYPLNWIYFFIPADIGMVIYVVIHFLLAGIFSYIFLKDLEFDHLSSLAGSIFYSFSGFMAIRIIHMNFITDCALLPLCLYCVNILFRRKNILSSLILGLCLSFSVLSGNYQMSLMVYIIVFIYFLAKLEIKELKKQLIPAGLFFTSIMFSLMVMAVQLLPTLEYLGQTMRLTGGLPYDMATENSVELKQLLLFIIPDYFGSPGSFKLEGHRYYCEACFYTGFFPLFLTLIALFLSNNKEKKILFMFAFIGATGFMLSLGKFTPAYWIFYNIAPLFKSYRVPFRWLFLLLPGMLYAIALSTCKLARIEKPVTYRECPGLIISILAAPSVMTGILLFILIRPPASNTGTVFFIITGLAGFIIIFLKIYCKISGKIFFLFTIITLIISAFSFGLNLNPTIERDYFTKTTEQLFGILQNRIPPERIYYHPPIEYISTINMAGTRKISTIIGYNPSSLKRYGEYILYSEHQVPLTYDRQLEFIKWTNAIPLNNLNSKMLLLLNLTSIYSFKKNQHDYNMHIIPVNNPYERAFTVNTCKIITDDYKTLEYMKSDKFDPLSEILLSEDCNTRKSGIIKKINYPVKYQVFEPDYIKIKVYPAEPCWLFLSEIYYPGWKSFVDGKERKIYRANYMFRAIELKECDNTVEFYFRPDSFKKGTTISILAMLILSGFLLSELFKYPKGLAKNMKNN
ncbi:MAG: YfhO family protein [Candidatus Eremiobacterota bacterium]